VTKALAPLAVLVAAALGVAGCGNSEGGGGVYGSGGTTAGKPGSRGPAEAGGAVVSAATTPKLGKILVDSEGLTLYDFQKDRGTNSSCYGSCAQVWPPLPSEGAPQAGEGAAASKLGTTRRKDGTMQVTYAGHPLYTYVEDTKPGDTNGNDFSSFGARWHALKPSGEDAGG
jgi:predicted lipoprotein with Yx(FWY)xxD motif